MTGCMRDIPLAITTRPSGSTSPLRANCKFQLSNMCVPRAPVLLLQPGALPRRGDTGGSEAGRRRLIIDTSSANFLNSAPLIPFCLSVCVCLLMCRGEGGLLLCVCVLWRLWDNFSLRGTSVLSCLVWGITAAWGEPHSHTDGAAFVQASIFSIWHLFNPLLLATQKSTSSLSRVQTSM